MLTRVEEVRKARWSSCPETRGRRRIRAERVVNPTHTKQHNR